MSLTISDRTQGDVRIITVASEHQAIAASVDLPDLFKSTTQSAGKVIISLAGLEGLQGAFTSAILHSFREAGAVNTNLVLAAPNAAYYAQLDRMGLPLRIPIFTSEATAMAAFSDEKFKPTDSWHGRNDFLVQAGSKSYDIDRARRYAAAAIGARIDAPNLAQLPL